MNARSWGHGHTFVGGAIAGLALSYRPWLIFAAGVIVGATLTLLFKMGRRLARIVAPNGKDRPAARSFLKGAEHGRMG